MEFTPEGRKRYDRDEKVMTVKEACRHTMALNEIIPGLPLGHNTDIATEIKDNLIASIKEARDQILDPSIATINNVKGWNKDMEKVARWRFKEHLKQREAELMQRLSRN